MKRRRQPKLLGWTTDVVPGNTPSYRRRERDTEIVVTWFRDKGCATIHVRGQATPEDAFIANLPVEGNNIAETLQRVNLMLKYGGLTALATLKEAMDTLRAL